MRKEERGKGKGERGKKTGCVRVVTPYIMRTESDKV